MYVYFKHAAQMSLFICMHRDAFVKGGYTSLDGKLTISDEDSKRLTASAIREVDADVFCTQVLPSEYSYYRPSRDRESPCARGLPEAVLAQAYIHASHPNYRHAI